MVRGAGAIMAGTLFAACGVDEGNPMDIPSAVRCEHPTEVGPVDPVVYESAIVEPGPQDLLPATMIDGKHFIGAAFTTDRFFTVTGLGAHVYSLCSGCAPTEVSMSIVPLDAVTQLPRTNTLSDAICWTVGAVPNVESTTSPEPLESTLFPTNFMLPPGTWGLVIATTRFETFYREALLPVDVTQVGPWSYFHYFEGEGAGQGPETGQWRHTAMTDGGPERLFVTGR